MKQLTILEENKNHRGPETNFMTEIEARERGRREKGIRKFIDRWVTALAEQDTDI